MIEKHVSNESISEALTYLAESDEECAKALALMRKLEKQEKSIIAMGFDAAQAGSAEARKQAAIATREYLQWLEDYDKSVLDYHLIKNKRDTYVLKCELWRSVNANRNRGNVR